MRSLCIFMGFAFAGAKDEAGCTITAAECKNFPEYNRKQFRDLVGEEHLNARDNEAACLKRAEDFHHWCGNGGLSGAQVAATFNKAKWSQVYHPGACDKGWSQWDAFCYKHYWEKRNWFEAEKLCRDRGSHLASIHSQAENHFIYTLTSGLSAWIGYTDLDQDTHYKWSDSTQDDFSNFAKNCTGREHEPDCKPEDRQQQWYDWNGAEEGTFVCKRNALLPMAILLNTTAETLLNKPWSSLLPVLSADGLAKEDAGSPSGKPLPAAPLLKVDDRPTRPEAKGSTVPAAERPLEPRIALPKGSWL